MHLIKLAKSKLTALLRSTSRNQTRQLLVVTTLAFVIITLVIFTLPKPKKQPQQLDQPTTKTNTVTTRPTLPPQPGFSFPGDISEYRLVNKQALNPYMDTYDLVDSSNTKTGSVIDLPKDKYNYSITNITDSGLVYISDSKQVVELSLATKAFRSLYTTEDNTEILNITLSPDTAHLFITIGELNGYEFSSYNTLFDLTLADLSLRQVGTFHAGVYTIFRELDYIDGYDLVYSGGGDGCGGGGTIYKAVNGELQPIFDFGAGCVAKPRYFAYLPDQQALLVGELTDDFEYDTNLNTIANLFSIKDYSLTKLSPDGYGFDYQYWYNSRKTDQFIVRATDSDKKYLVKLTGSHIEILQAIPDYVEFQLWYWLDDQQVVLRNNSNRLLIHNLYTNDEWLLVYAESKSEMLPVDTWNGSIVLTSRSTKQ